MPENGCILGFDYGERRIGIAVGEHLTRTARPLTTLTSHDGKPDWTAIHHLLEEWRPARLVVGLPLHLDGKEQPMTDRARRFGAIDKVAAQLILQSWLEQERNE